MAVRDIFADSPPLRPGGSRDLFEDSPPTNVSRETVKPEQLEVKPLELKKGPMASVQLAAIGIDEMIPEPVREKLHQAYNYVAEKFGGTEIPEEGLKALYNDKEFRELVDAPDTQFALGTANTVLHLMEKVPEFKEYMEGADLGDSGYRTAGKFFDPVMLKIAKVFQKWFPYKKVFGEGGEGAKAVAKNVTGGTLSGATAGVLNPDFTAAEGAGYGAAGSTIIPPVAAGVAKGWQKGKEVIAPIFGKTDPSVAKIANTVAGKDANTIAQHLRQSQPGQNAGQAALPVKNAEFSGMQGIANATRPTDATRLKAQQIAARQKTLADVKPDLETATKVRSDVTGPMRTTELNTANLASEKAAGYTSKLAQKEDSIINALKDRWQLATTAKQQAHISKLPAHKTPKGRIINTLVEGKTMRPNEARYNPHRPHPQGAGNVKGYPNVPPRYSPHKAISNQIDDAVEDVVAIEAQRKAEKEFLQYQLDSLQAHGLKPLRTEEIISKVEQIFNKRGIRVSDVVEDTGIYISSKLQKFTKPDGTIDAYDLYGIRKDIGKLIKSFQKARGVYDKEVANNLQREIQMGIDDAIESSGATGWKKYLETFSELSKPIEQSKAIGLMQESLKGTGGKERIEPFMNLIGRGEENLVRKATNYPGYSKGDLEEILSPTQKIAKKLVESQLDADVELRELTKAGASKAAKVVGMEVSSPELPNWLNPKITLTKSLLKRLHGMGGEKSTEALAEMMINNPKKLGEIMEKYPEVINHRLLQAILNSKNPQVLSGILASIPEE